MMYVITDPSKHSDTVAAAIAFLVNHAHGLLSVKAIYGFIIKFQIVNGPRRPRARLCRARQASRERLT